MDAPALRQERQFQSILRDVEAQYKAKGEGAAELSKYLGQVKSVDDLETQITKEHDAFSTFRAKKEGFFGALKACLTPLEAIGVITSNAATDVFPPGQSVFAAVMYLVNAARDVSACYDAIIELFEQLQYFTKRLGFYTKSNLSAELQEHIVTILVTLFEVFVIAANEIKKGRVRLYFKSLLGGGSGINDAMERLAALTDAEDKLVGAETLFEVKSLEEGQERIVDKLSRMEDRQLQAEQFIHGDRLKAILKPSPYPKDYYLSIVKSTTPGTGTWISDSNKTYEDWAFSAFPFLFLSGEAGVGKSYLMAHLITDLINQFNCENGKSQRTQSSVGYFFFRNNNPETRDVHQALCDIAYQVSEDNVYYTRYLLNQLRSSDEIKTIPSAFRKLFLEPCMNKQAKLFIFLDGLDEAYQDEMRELLTEMSGLKQGSNIQVALAGRPQFNDILLELFDEGHGFNGRLKAIPVSGSNNKRDVRMFIENNFSNIRSLRRAPAELKQQLVDKLVSKSDGLFIMAKFMLSDLESQTHSRRMLETVENYPKEVNQLLQRVLAGLASNLQNVDQAEDLNEILRWVTCARKTLTLGQLKAILKVKFDYADWDLEILEHTIRGTYASFVTLDRDDGLTTADLIAERDARLRQATLDGEELPEDEREPLDFNSNDETTQVVFFHASIGEFFCSDDSNDVKGGDQTLGFEINEAQLYIAKTCLKIFTDPKFHAVGNHGASLKKYAAMYWQEHVGDLDPDKTSAADKAEIGQHVYKMLTDDVIIWDWTADCVPQDITDDEALTALRRFLADPHTTQSLDADAKKWVESAAINPYILLEPVGRLFARAWLDKPFPSYRPTNICAKIVQGVAYMEKSGKWLAEDKDRDVRSTQKIEVALAWTTLEKTPWWYLRLGSTYLTLRDYGKALELYNVAKDMPGGDTIETWARIAVCYQKQREYRLALEMYLKCEREELEKQEMGVLDEKDLNQSMWGLYKDQFQAAQCYAGMSRIEKSAEYFRKAIKSARDREIFEPETAYIELLTTNNRFPEVLLLLREMDRPSSVPDKANTRLSAFLIFAAAEPTVLEWIPRAAYKSSAIPFVTKQYGLAIREAREQGDTIAEVSLKLGRALIALFSRNYDLARLRLEEIVISDYKGKGSQPIRTTHTKAFKALAYLYKQIVLHMFPYATTANAPEKVSVNGDIDSGLPRASPQRYITQLELLRDQLTTTQKVNTPPRLLGESHNDASMYLGLLERCAGKLGEARSIFKPLVLEALDILDDDEPQNDTYALDNLCRVLMVAGDVDNAKALHQSMRPPVKGLPGSVTSSVGLQQGVEPAGVQSIYSGSAQGHREPYLPNIQSLKPFCVQCLESISINQEVAICQFCIDPLCLRCLEEVRVAKPTMFEENKVLETSCRADHDWVLLKPLGRQLLAGEILVGDEVVKLTEWKDNLREKWTTD